MVDGQGVYSGNTLTLASPPKVILVDKVLAQIKIPRYDPGRPKSRPKRLLGDRVYDSDALRKNLSNRQIKLYARTEKMITVYQAYLHIAWILITLIQF
jgi:hypothetical protein